jgi:hypothetical protein
MSPEFFYGALLKAGTRVFLSKSSRLDEIGLAIEKYLMAKHIFPWIWLASLREVN